MKMQEVLRKDGIQRWSSISTRRLKIRGIQECKIALECAVSRIRTFVCSLHLNSRVAMD